MSRPPLTEGRDRFVDAVRVVAVGVVVIGHWTATTVVWSGDRIVGENALSVLPATHPATWVLQVMPLLFFAGGFANAKFVDRAEGGYLPYAGARLRRILVPTGVFLSGWLIVGAVAAVVGLEDPNVLEAGADIVALPFWFLGLYVVVVALAPSLLRLHRRLGWGVPAGMVAGAAAVDVAVHGLGFQPVGVLNYAFVWLLPHQLGFFYADGTLRHVARRHTIVAAGAGLGAIVALVTLAGYPVSMIGVPGEARWNTDPPSVALVALTVWLVAGALTLRPLLEKLGGTAVIGRMQRRVLTLYLWHVSALVVGAAILVPAGLTRTDTGSAAWWLARVPWLIALAVALAGLVALFGRFESHPTPPAATPRDAPVLRRFVLGVGVVSVAIGLFGFGVTGFDHPWSNPGEDVLGLTTNPVRNLLHVTVGVVAIGAAYRAAAVARAVLIVAVIAYLAAGLVGISQGLDALAINRPAAVLHLAVGAVGGVGALWMRRRPQVAA